MKILFSGFLLLFSLALGAAPVTITVEAPKHPDRQVLLYRYMDAFTRRTERIAEGRTDAKGHVVLTADVEGTQRALLKIGELGADLYLRSGKYHVKMLPPDTGEALSISGTARTDLLFIGLDHLDVNALVSDLNERLDAFLATDLATDQNAGMEAVAKVRNGTETITPDTAKGGARIYLSPRWDEARVDTFARKLRKFYAAVKDPWFQSDVEYGIAGLRLGPRTNDSTLFARYLKHRPVLYDVPEYTRFFTAFFKDHILRFPFREHTDAVLRDIRHARVDSLKDLLARNYFLKDDRLCELVLMTGLYAEQGNQLFDHAGILKVLEHIRSGSVYPEHRAIAANMLWDLTAMTTGTPLPTVDLLDSSGTRAHLDSLLHGPVCLLITATDGFHGEKELSALEQLRTEYSDYVQFIGIALDQTPQGLAAWLRGHPRRDWAWFTPKDQQRLLDAFRIRSIPVLFMLQDRSLNASPGPLPSQGLATVLFRIKATAKQGQRDRFLHQGPPPKH